MQFVPLEARHSYVPAETERSTEAAIVGELARHFLELRENQSASKASQLLHKLAAIHSVEPAALWVVLRLLTGDLNEITRSYADIGKENHRTKQGVQQELERVLAAIELHWPQLATAIIQLRNITADHNKQT